MAEVFCEASGKITYTSRNAASKALAQFKKKFKGTNKRKHGDLQVFKCNACSGWHLGRIHMGRSKRWSTTERSKA